MIGDQTLKIDLGSSANVEVNRPLETDTQYIVTFQIGLSVCLSCHVLHSLSYDPLCLQTTQTSSPDVTVQLTSATTNTVFATETISSSSLTSGEFVQFSVQNLVCISSHLILIV